MAATVDRARLRALLRAEEAAYAARNPKSYALYKEASTCLLAGVPMHWMVRSAGRFPVFVDSARGARFTSVDGHEYVDFCLGDTGAMAGHAPAAAAEAVSRRVAHGVTFMLPTADAVWVGRELQRRFRLPYWQFALTATDANRFAVRLARHVTGRPKILVFNWCYHGSVDEAFITLQPDGTTTPRAGNIGPPVHPAATTKVVEFNDPAALEAALADGDVAAVLAEPVMTNIGIIHPDPGYHQKLREITRRAGSLLIIDETHTICAGPGGYSGAAGLEPDIFVIGKPIAGGVPAAVYGFTEDLAARLRGRINDEESDTGGIGGTLAGNALSAAAMRATLEHVLTDGAFSRMIAMAERFEAGVLRAIAARRLPWIIKRLGCRVEYWFAPQPPRNGAEAAAAADAELDRFLHLAALNRGVLMTAAVAADAELDRFMHLAALNRGVLMTAAAAADAELDRSMHLAAFNRGVLMTPFHNMALMCPATTAADVDLHTAVFEECVELLLGLREPPAAPQPLGAAGAAAAPASKL